jgi:hypothetical protein
MAELLTEDSSLRPTTVIKRLIGTKNDSHIRRLQVKWKAEGRTLLSQAQERRETRRVSAAVATTSTRPSWLEAPLVKAAIEAQAWWAELFKPSPAMQAVIDAMKPSPAMQAVIDAMKPSPAMQTVIDAMKPSPAMQAAIDAMKPSPAMQAAIDDSNRWRKQFEQSPMFETHTWQKMF